MKESPSITAARKVYHIGGHAQFLPFWLPTGKAGNMRVVTETVQAGHSVPIVSLRNAIFMGMEPCNVSCSEPVLIHQLLQDKRGCWMQAMPQEVEQAHRQLAGAFGRVLVGGLGLGLALHVLESNPNVNSIVVCELSQAVISLVESFARRKPSTKIIHRDLYKHLAMCKRRGEKFDFAFYDIWAPTGQMELARSVIPLRRASIGVVDDQSYIECWNEDEMLGQIRLNMWHGAMLSMPKARFNRMAEADKGRNFIAQDWAFWNRARKEGWDMAKVQAEADRFIECLKNPVAYDANWKEWEP